MIPIDDQGLYNVSLDTIRRAVGRKFLGRPAQIFLAAKHYGKQIPQIGDPVGINSGELEDLLDSLYLKPSRTTPEKILILFKSSHKVPSRIKEGALKGPSNIWRNNLNLQKGYICFGSNSELLDPQFRNPSRLVCPHLAPAMPGSLYHARCALNLGPQYRHEDHPKMFRKDAVSGEYWIYDPTDSAFYSSIVLPANGNKLPLIPLIIALYFDGSLSAGRNSVDISDFLADFDFSPQEYAVYFDDDPESGAHQRILAVNPNVNWTRQPAPATAASPVDAALPGLPAMPAPVSPAQKATKDSGNIGSVTTSAPPATGHWWNAEQAVRSVLESDGWQILDVSRLGMGYDFKATKAGTVRLVEVKSAVGHCAPVLTEREYNEAKQSRKAYVLAIVEKFDPSKAVTIRWVQDPARLQMTIRLTKGYYVPRSIWNRRSLGTFPG